MWQIDEWIKLNGEGAAVIQPVNCTAVKINGSYIEGQPLNDDNFLLIDLNINKKGAFAISALSGNGYSFYYTGVAQQTGIITVKVPGQGTPALAQTDKLTFSGVSLVAGCEPDITVQEIVSAYTMLCSSAMVHGQYFKNQALNPQVHYIDMNINVSQPGSYNISTETKNGISFKAIGSFAGVGTFPVRLLGTGIPTINEDFNLTIKANTSLGSAVCSVLVPITLPDMTYMIIGSGAWFWNVAARRDALSNASSQSFGLNGVVKINRFTIFNGAPYTNIASATSALTNGISGKYPDIVLYYAYGAAPTTALSTALKNYINAGGCVIYGSADGTQNAVNILMQGLFGIQPAVAKTSNTSDMPYHINNFISDPILNGPFGNCSDQYWAEDNSGSVMMTSLPPNSIQLCSATSTANGDQNNDPVWSMVWYNNSKNFVYFGDSTSAANSTATNDYPARYNAQHLPIRKNYGNGSNEHIVYNSILEMNAVAWCIKRAAVSGINHY